MKASLSLLLLWYFKLCAQVQLWKIKPTIIGITGSAGKTSTLHAISAVLSPTHTIHASHKANSESGLPLDILGLQVKKYRAIDWLKLALLVPLQLLSNWKKYQIYIAEMGIDGPLPPKNMSYLLSIFRPKIGVLLTAQPVHSEGFDKFLPKNLSPTEHKAALSTAIATEKGKLITHLPPTGLAVLNYDEQPIRDLAKQTRAKILFFGTTAQADIQLLETKNSLTSTQYTLRNTNNSATTTISFTGYALPKKFGYTIAAACAVADFFGISLAEAGKNIAQNFINPPARSSLIPGINNSIILDSSYNAASQTMLDSLDLLNTIAPGRKMALLGDMREIGTLSQQEHELVARKVLEVCEHVVLVGPLMKQFVLPILETSKIPHYWFPSAQQAGEFLATELKSNDLLLVKASQNTLLLEIAVEMLMRNPQDAEKLLCRRGTFWSAQRDTLRRKK
jgi:UDP-N-acetylmuramoyl-tripeptide--D-alanyl-D-alanine ligase